MKKILLTILAFLFLIPIFFAEATGYLGSPACSSESACKSAYGTWKGKNLSCDSSCECVGTLLTPSAGACDCISNIYTFDKTTKSCVLSSVGSTTRASNCTSIYCGGVQASFNSTTGCTCPSGYESDEVDSFNDTYGYSGATNSTGTSTTGTGTGTGTSTGITTPTVTSTGTLTNPITSTSFEALLESIIDWILNIAMVLAPLIIVCGGFVYMTAAGDTSKVSQGKNIVLYAVIGFVVALLAKSLIGIFKDLVVK
ncbi:MAG: pilin [Minisyncoccales bacterium]